MVLLEEGGRRREGSDDVKLLRTLSDRSGHGENNLAPA